MNLVDKSRKENYFFVVALTSWVDHRMTEPPGEEGFKEWQQKGWAGDTVSAKSANRASLGSPRNPVLPCTCYCTCHHVLLQHPCWVRTLNTTAGAHTELSLTSGCCGCCDLHHPLPHWLFCCLTGSLYKLHTSQAKPESYVLAQSA